MRENTCTAHIIYNIASESTRKILLLPETIRQNWTFQVKAFGQEGGSQ